MIALIDRYIGRTVMVSMLVMLLAFIGLMSLFALLEELRDADETYSLAEAMWYVVLTTPRRIYEVLPYVVFLGVLVGLGSLASRSEIVVLRASGVSPARIFASVAWPAAVLFAAGMVVGEVIAPRGEVAAESYASLAVNESDVIELSRAYWYREGDMVMRVRALSGGGELLGVDQYWYSPARTLQLALSARSAEFVDGDSPYWLLRDVVETRFSENRTITRELAETRWQGKVNPGILSIRVLVDPRMLAVDDLHRQIQYMDREGLNADTYRLAFWSKLFQPLSALGLALLALGFILGPLRQVSMGVRLSVGIFVGLGFKYLQDLFAPMSIVFDLPPVVAVLLPILACWLIGAWGLKRVG